MFKLFSYGTDFIFHSLFDRARRRSSTFSAFLRRASIYLRAWLTRVRVSHVTRLAIVLVVIVEHVDGALELVHALQTGRHQVQLVSDAFFVECALGRFDSLMPELLVVHLEALLGRLYLAIDLL